MDSFFTSPPGGSAQPVQQVPIQPAEPLVQNPIQKPPQQKVNLKKILNLGTWVILFALAPLTVLIFLSQDSIPGDYFYPVKRGMENVILAAASVNPAVRAAFRTDLTEARFKEAQSLVISKANASGLTSFTDDVQAVRLEVASLTDNTERAKAEDKLLAKIDQYQNSLTNLQAKTEQNLIAYSVQETPAPTSIPPTSVQNLPSADPTFTPTPLPSPLSLPKSSPTSPPVNSDLMPTSTPTPILTLTPVPTVVPTIPIQQGDAQIAKQEEIAQTLKDTKEKLNKIKKELEEKRGENKNENENQNKNNFNKKANANRDGANPQAK